MRYWVKDFYIEVLDWVQVLCAKSENCIHSELETCLYVVCVELA